jgi:hypothetical protein
VDNGNYGHPEAEASADGWLTLGQWINRDCRSMGSVCKLQLSRAIHYILCCALYHYLIVISSEVLQVGKVFCGKVDFNCLRREIFYK